MKEVALDGQVLIVGAGPTGLTLAILLAQLGVSVLLVEREADVYPLPRAAHIDHETIRIFQEAGVADVIAATSRSATSYDFLTAKRDLLFRFGSDNQLGPGGWPAANMIHQPSIERALRARLSRLPNATFLTATQVVDFAQDASGVTATVQDATGQRQIRAAYIIGADGARSTVRQKAGIEFENLGFNEQWLVVDVIVSDFSRLPTANLQVCDPKRPTTCVVMGVGRHRWEFMIKPGEDPEFISSDANIKDMLKPWDVEGAVEIERKAVYTFRALIAKHWRKGRVIVAGDAAHQMPPFAGQGLCSGVRDVANLAWKLAAVVQNGADPALLDDYQLERGPNVRAVVDMAIKLGRLVCVINPIAAFTRNTILTFLRRLNLLPKNPPAFPGLKQGQILKQTMLAGTYFPQLRLDAAPTQRMDDVFGSGAWLITHGPVEASVPHLQCISIDQVKSLSLKNALDEWLQNAGVEAVLVRPDRYVFGTGNARDLQHAWKSAMSARPNQSHA